MRQPLDAAQIAHQSTPLTRTSRLILGGAVIVSVVGLVLIWALVKPTYKSTAVVRLTPVQPKNNEKVQLYNRYLNTQVSIIRSPTVINRVLDREDVQNTHWCKEEERRLAREPMPPADRLVEALSVQLQPNKQLMTL